jgi:hypothetical protein
VNRKSADVGSKVRRFLPPDSSRADDDTAIRSHHVRTQVFAEDLFGGVHGFNSVFPSINGAPPSANAFAMQIGGGLDYSVSSTLSIRVIDAHYVRTDLPNGFTNRQSDLLLGAGIVWRPFDRSAKR